MKEITFKGAYLGGRFRRPSLGKQPRVKQDPGDTAIILGRWSATLDQLEAAVEAASGAFPKWAGERQVKRLAYLKSLQKVFRRRRSQLAQRISQEMGKALAESLKEVDASIARIDSTLAEGLGLIQSTRGKSPHGYYEYHPRGVLAVLAPFNFPLHLPNSNLIPALATGNTVVLKPSELTPFTGQMIAECFFEAEFPKGVFNMLQGGAAVGRSLAGHPKVSGVLFVGSDKVGFEIQRQVQNQPGKICVLEMGGKNAAVIFSDTNLKLALQQCLISAYSTTGQRCTSLARILIQQPIAEKFIDKFVKGAADWQAGYYQDPKAQMGPLVSEEAVTKFLSYQRKATQEGAEVLLSGRRLKLAKPGYYVSPSVHAMPKKTKKSNKKSSYRYDEIFGPDVAIYSFNDPEEAIQIHNDSRFGLVASVFTPKKSVFRQLVRELEVGNVFLNRPTIGASAHLPFGGVKSSGNHFPAGLFSPYYCTYPKSVLE